MGQIRRSGRETRQSALPSDIISRAYQVRKCQSLNRCAIARCAGSPTVSAVTGGKVVKTSAH